MKDIIGEAQTIDTRHPAEKHKDTPCTNRSPSTHTHSRREPHRTMPPNTALKLETNKHKTAVDGKHCNNLIKFPEQQFIRQLYSLCP